MLKDISWDILHNNIPQHQTRKIIEALEISKNIKFPRGNYQPIVPRQKHSIV